MMGVLRNLKYERFAQLVVAGREPDQAYEDVGGTAKNKRLAAQNLMNRPLVRHRIEELMDVGARKAQLSRSKILERIYEDWESARRLGQIPAALKAAEMMGKEMHKMFVDRKEVGNAGDFDQKSPEELLAYIKEQLKEAGLDAKQLGINLEDFTQIAPGTDTVN